jgi:hypothetical protein
MPLFYCDTRLYGQERFILGDPREALMRVPDDLLQCVGFLCVQSGEWLYGGTGFFVRVMSEADPVNVWYGYFVTAKHCVLKAQEYGDLHIRLNGRKGGFVNVRIAAPWIFPEDPSVDLAIIPFAPPLEVVEFRYAESTMLASDETVAQHSIGIGDDLVICGLFTKHYGKTKNLPIARFGNIAAMPFEPLPDRNTGLGYHAYLIEARSIGGLSGSPVFAYLGPSRVVNNTLNLEQFNIILLGVIRGHWDHEESGVDFVRNEVKNVNMGIAIATPAQEIRKILFSEEWVNNRRLADVRVAKKKNPITEDDAFKKPFTKDDFDTALKKVTRKIEPKPKK